MTIGDENISIIANYNVRRGIEVVGATTHFSRRTQHQQNLPRWGELNYLVTTGVAIGNTRIAYSIGNPHIAIFVDIDAVWPNKHPTTETLNYLPFAIKFQDRVQIGIHTLITETIWRGGITTHYRPDVLAIWINIEIANRTLNATIGQLRPAFDSRIGV